MMTTTRIDDLTERAGTELGASDWVAVTQEAVDAFAAATAATSDHQWMHTDPRAPRTRRSAGRSRMATTRWRLRCSQVLPLDGFAMAVKYGPDRLQFPAPPPTGEQVRMRVGLDALEPVPGGAARSLPDVRARGGRQAGVRRERRLPRLRAEVI